jgi:hypothetical protein
MLYNTKDEVNVKDRQEESSLDVDVVAGKRLAGGVKIFSAVTF